MYSVIGQIAFYFLLSSIIKFSFQASAIKLYFRPSPSLQCIVYRWKCLLGKQKGNGFLLHEIFFFKLPIIIWFRPHFRWKTIVLRSIFWNYWQTWQRLLVNSKNLQMLPCWWSFLPSKRTDNSVLFNFTNYTLIQK